jgi:type I restriction enzyme S subunit
MTGAYSSTPLGQLLTRSLETIQIDPLQEYQEVTARLWGKGVVRRRYVRGSEVKGRRYVARAGQFILSRIDARHGANGIVPDELSGAIVTNDFPVFDFDHSRLEPKYLQWLGRTHDFIQLCLRASEGTTNRVRLSEERFLDLPIPLPTVEEQRRVVWLIEQLHSKIVEATALRRVAVEEIDALITSEELKIWPASGLKDAPSLEYVTIHLSRGKQSEQGESEHYLIKTQHVQQDHYIPTRLKLAPHAAMKVKPEAIAEEGDILIACSAAGCLGRVAHYSDPSKQASTDTHVAIARPNIELVEPGYLYAYLRGAQGQIQLRSRERGDWQREKISFRLTELNVADLRQVPVPLPDRAEQRRIVKEVEDLRAQVNLVRKLQIETAAEIDAMVPAVLDKAFRGKL